MASHRYSTSFRTSKGRIFLEVSRTALEEMAIADESELETLARCCRVARTLCAELPIDQSATCLLFEAEDAVLTVRLRRGSHAWEAAPGKGMP